MTNLPEQLHPRQPIDTTTDQRPAPAPDASPPPATSLRSPQVFYEQVTARSDIRELLGRLAQIDPHQRPEGTP